ncbi:uncharacterized protein LOC127783744 [Oryza glaberrima]|uniref:uncharacterized protein LOC127783744 n=1 Tax=Oryza glaberrima TaxID=4538 RepID=UPI00224C53F8|nr:uncharacterized protein LOC127783744 [Oryza glaberrima]
MTDQFKGKFGCLICIDKTSYKYLTSIGKVVYMRHRWFLPQRHRWRAKDRLFDKTVENDLAPETRTGAQVFELTKNIKVVFRKGKKKAVRRMKRMDQNNTDATYEETALPFNKHSIFFSYLEYWKDQEVRHAIDLMHLEKNVFDSTIGTLLDIPKDGLKLCTDLINLDIRHELHPKELANGKIEIPPACYSKVFDPEELGPLQTFAIETAGQLEMFFPLAYFNMTEHLIVHIVPQIIEIGPLYLHQMWAYERYMSVLKGYAPGTGIIGKKRFYDEDYRAVAEAHSSVLQQLAIVEPYIEEHMNEIRANNPRRTATWISKEQKRKFPEWLKEKELTFGESLEEKTLHRLANGPSSLVTSWQGYDIGGYRFYTICKDKKSAAQNSGVRMEAFDASSEKKSYYGITQDIWELAYVLNIQIPVLRCQWVRDTTGVSIDNYDLTIVERNKLGHKDDPWVLAERVA